MGLGAGKRPSRIPNVSEDDLVEVTRIHNKDVGNYSLLISNIKNWLISDNKFQGHRNPPPPPLKEYKGRFAYQDDEDLMNEIDTLLGLKFEVPEYVTYSTYQLMIEARKTQLKIDYDLYEIGKKVEEMKKK